MQAEIVTTGSELLLGELVDTNSAFIARQLRSIGVHLQFTTSVGDHVGRMVVALQQALARSELVITTGGLGPTVDDVTRQAVAEATGRDLVLEPVLLDQIAARFRRYGSPMGDNNRQQAYIPRGATAIENPVGTAPAFAVEHAGCLVISLPGVPREMEYLMTQAVLPMLRARCGDAVPDQVIVVRTLHVIGLGESRIDAAVADLERLDNPSVGLSAHPGQTDVRIAASAPDQAAALALIAPVETQARSALPNAIYGVDDDTIEAVVVRLLTGHGLKLLTLEQGTSGRLAGRLSGAPGAGEVFHHGLVLPSLGAPVEKATSMMRQSSDADLVLGVSVEVGEQEGALQVSLALATSGDTQLQTRGFGGHSRLAPEWASTLGLGMLWQHLKN